MSLPPHPKIGISGTFGRFWGTIWRIDNATGPPSNFLLIGGRKDKLMLDKPSDIVRLLKSDHSVRNTAKITGKGFSTVQRVRAAMGKDRRALETPQ